MVQLTIPQSLVGSLIDIAQLADITYYPANNRCAHWAVYGEDQTELLCPCAPTESASVEKLFSAASEILYKNFRHRIENADDIVSFSAQDHEDVLTAQADEAATGSLPLVSEDTMDAAANAPADAIDDSPVKNSENPESHEHPLQTSAPGADESAAGFSSAPVIREAQPPQQEVPQVPTPGIARMPSPAMFRKKSSLTFTPPRIEEYLQQLRENQAAQSSDKKTDQASGTAQQTSRAAASQPAVQRPQGSAVQARGQQAQPSGQQGSIMHSLDESITKAERTANYRVDPGRLAAFKKDNIDLVTIREVITLGRAERINGWVIRFRHNDYRVDVNTASMTVINALDEFDEFDERTGTDYSPEAAREVLGTPDITACDFTPGAQNYLKTHGGEAFDAMVNAIASPEKVRVNLDWTREYHGSGVQVTISPDNRIVLSIRKLPESETDAFKEAAETSLDTGATASQG